MNRLLLLLLLLSLTSLTVLAQDAQPEETSIPLVVGQVFSDSLAATDVHAYTIDLAADQFVYGEADQLSVDVVVTIYSPEWPTWGCATTLASRSGFAGRWPRPSA